MATKSAFQRNLRDADLRVTHALPGAASTTVTSTPIDLGALSFGGSNRPGGLEVVFRVAALDATALPDTKTTTLSIEASDDVTFGTGVAVLATKVVTGAGGVGAAATEVRAAVADSTLRYLRAKAVTGALTGDQSAVVGEFCVVA
jgi:hypothetical protein